MSQIKHFCNFIFEDHQVASLLSDYFSIHISAKFHTGMPAADIFVILYSTKFWQGKTSANRLFQGLVRITTLASLL